MKYMTIEEYIILRYTPNSRPSKKTIIRLINKGVLPGKKLGKFYYVMIERESSQTGDLLSVIKIMP